MSTKQITFLNNIIFKHLPEFTDNLAAQQALLDIVNKYPKVVDVENLIEHALAAEGGYDFIDEEGRDFNDVDDSDSKTVTVNRGTGKAEVGSIENKIGSIRLTIYNPLSLSKLDFMYLPRYAVAMLARNCYGKQSHKKRLIPTWTGRFGTQGHYNMFEAYRLTNFSELATMTDRKFYTQNPNLAPYNLKVNLGLISS